MARGARTKRAVITFPPDTGLTSADARRVLLADYCKMICARVLGHPVVEPTPAPIANPSSVSNSSDSASSAPSPAGQPLEGLNLSPRLEQTLDRLLQGDSEKQIAARLGISQHTVHTYVKQLHKLLGATSRGELLAKFVRR